MYRLFIFLTGLAVSAAALPQVLSHHARAELMQLAWCSSTGNSAPDAGFFGMHCAACPVLFAGILAMLVSVLLSGNRLDQISARVRS